MAKYSEEFKLSIIKQMMPPQNKTVSILSKENGIAEQTLFKWKREAKAKGIVITDGEAQSEKWSTHDKFMIVVETASLNAAELSEYCRQKGLYVEQVESWRDACMQANGGVAEEASRLNKESKEKDKEIKKLQKELKRKEEALAETAALIVLRKKAQAIWGGPRGRMISREDRILVIDLIDDAVTNGAREFKACEVLNISHRTLFRWRSKNTPDEDQRPLIERPEPNNKLSLQEKERIIEVVNSPEFKSLPPSQIVPALADQGEYIASESTMYKVLKEYSMQHHRGLSKAPVKRPISTHYADGPNQVWMWDISYMPAGIKGKYHYLYLILDLYSRKIIAWEVYEKESAEYASRLVRRAVMSENRTKDKRPLILHSDNGSPMKGATLLETLIMLGVMPSNSRPRVSNDNAYAEAIFKTLKYRPGYPRKGLATIEEARSWVLEFARWYNKQHHHSGINFLTPEQRHSGQGKAVLANRKAVYEAAKLKNPNRWSRNTRNWDLEERVWLNPENEESIEFIEEKSS